MSRRAPLIGATAISRCSSLLLLVLLLLAGLPGCRTLSTGTPTIRFWNGFTGPDGRTMRQQVKRFNGENPGVHVGCSAWTGTHYNKLFVAGLGHRAPEVSVVHADNIPRFMRADFLRPVDDFFGGEGGFEEGVPHRPAALCQLAESRTATHGAARGEGP